MRPFLPAHGLAFLTLRRISAMLVPTLVDWGSVYLGRDGGSIALAAIAHVDPNRSGSRAPHPLPG